MPKNNSTTRNVEVLTLEEQEKYINVLNSTKYELFFLTSLFTGMRLGELVALKKKNIDLVDGTIKVCESYRRTTKYDEKGNAERIIDKKTPKTETSNRIIPLPTFLKELLKKHMAKSDNEYVFYTSNGNHMTPENVRRIQISLCQKANIPYKNFHSLRHTYATRLIENGTDIKTVSLLLGHSDVNITLSTYVHSTDDTQINAVNSLENLYKKKMHQICTK